MDPDIGHWVDLALRLASAHPDVDHHEVRADTQVDKRVGRRVGIVRNVGTKHLGGIGVRVFSGRGTGFAYTNELSRASLDETIDRAAGLAVANDRSARYGFPPQIGPARKATYRPQVRDHPDEADPAALQDLLTRAETALQGVAPQAKSQVSFGYKSTHQVIADSAGTWIDTQALHSTLLVQAVMRDGGNIGDGNTWVGGERGLGDYEDDGGPEALGRHAAEETLESLRARAIPSGRYRVMTDNHLTGVMVHESFGHLNEYDLVASGWSALAGRMGETLAAKSITIRDVPMMDGREGVKVPYDQEGTPGQPVTILEKGVLRSYLHTRDSAATDESRAAGNARALNVCHPPIVRMRNTYMEPGDLSMDEAFQLLGDGVYLIGGRGGSPRADGSFMFSSQRGYVVENGEPKQPIKMASIYGNVLDFLTRIEGLTTERKVYTTYFGGCGKWDQSFLHIGNGGPHVVVSEALLGSQGGGDANMGGGGGGA